MTFKPGIQRTIRFAVLSLFVPMIFGCDSNEGARRELANAAVMVVEARALTNTELRRASDKLVLAAESLRKIRDNYPQTQLAEEIITQKLRIEGVRSAELLELAALAKDLQQAAKSGEDSIRFAVSNVTATTDEKLKALALAGPSETIAAELITLLNHDSNATVHSELLRSITEMITKLSLSGQIEIARILAESAGDKLHSLSGIEPDTVTFAPFVSAYLQVAPTATAVGRAEQWFDRVYDPERGKPWMRELYGNDKRALERAAKNRVFETVLCLDSLSSPRQNSRAACVNDGHCRNAVLAILDGDQTVSEAILTSCTSLYSEDTWTEVKRLALRLSEGFSDWEKARVVTIIAEVECERAPHGRGPEEFKSAVGRVASLLPDKPIPRELHEWPPLFYMAFRLANGCKVSPAARRYLDPLESFIDKYQANLSSWPGLLDQLVRNSSLTCNCKNLKKWIGRRLALAEDQSDRCHVAESVHELLSDSPTCRCLLPTRCALDEVPEGDFSRVFVARARTREALMSGAIERATELINGFGDSFLFSEEAYAAVPKSRAFQAAQGVQDRFLKAQQLLKICYLGCDTTYHECKFELDRVGDDEQVAFAHLLTRETKAASEDARCLDLRSSLDAQYQDVPVNFPEPATKVSGTKFPLEALIFLGQKDRPGPQFLDRARRLCPELPRIFEHFKNAHSKDESSQPGSLQLLGFLNRVGMIPSDADCPQMAEYRRDALEDLLLRSKIDRVLSGGDGQT